MNGQVWKARERDFLRLHYGPLAKQPWSTKRIAAALGRSAQQIRVAADRFGFAWRTYGNATDKILLALYHQGRPDKEIAFAAEVDRKTVVRWRHRHSLPPNTRWKRCEDHIEAILHLRESGLSWRQISKDLGINRDKIREWVKIHERKRETNG